MNIDDTNNINLYETLLKKYGEDYRALDWGSESSQNLRFSILNEIGLKKNDKVLDIGCGLSDFYGWLQKHNPKVKYSGLDITPGMIMQSKSRFPELDFYLGSIHDIKIESQKFDYLIASGIFVFRTVKPKDYMCKTIKKMYKLSKKGIAFNSLSSLSKNKSHKEFYGDPCETFKFCKSFSSRVVLRHDYHDGDFTIYMYK